MPDLLRFRVDGIEELGEGLETFIQQLMAELRPGFVPEARYLGEQGRPFTLEKIDLVAKQVGFVVRDG